MCALPSKGGEYEGRRMTVFLRWMTTTWVLKERTLCPRSMSTIGAHVSALMYVFKVLWKAAYVGMRDRREKKLAGVTVEEAGVIYGGSMASTVSMTSPVPRAVRPNSRFSSTARMNSSVTRTELLAFWYWTEVMSLPPRSMS